MSESEERTRSLNEARDKLLEYWENVVILVSRREGGLTDFNERSTGNHFAMAKHAEVFARELSEALLEQREDV